MATPTPKRTKRMAASLVSLLFFFDQSQEMRNDCDLQFIQQAAHTYESCLRAHVNNITHQYRNWEKPVRMIRPTFNQSDLMGEDCFIDYFEKVENCIDAATTISLRISGSMLKTGEEHLDDYKHDYFNATAGMEVCYHYLFENQCKPNFWAHIATLKFSYDRNGCRQLTTGVKCIIQTIEEECSSNLRGITEQLFHNVMLVTPCINDGHENAPTLQIIVSSIVLFKWILTISGI